MTLARVAQEDEVRALVLRLWRAIARREEQGQVDSVIAASPLTLAEIIGKVIPCIEELRASLDENEKLRAEAIESTNKAILFARQLMEATRKAEGRKASIDALKKQLDEVRKATDLDEIELRIMYETDKRCEAMSAELTAARAEVAALKSETEELKRSKKRLREALDRLSRET